MQLMQPVFRFAPSPNGLLHLGHAYSALLNQAMAREAGGRMLLRIDDLDRTRCTPALEAAMLRDLEWLGFQWEGEARRQSDHAHVYREAIDTLQDAGLAYPAFMGRGEIRRLMETRSWPGGPEGPGGPGGQGGPGGEDGEGWPRDPDGAPHYPGDDRVMDAAMREELLQAGTPHALRLDMGAALAHLSLDADAELSWPESGSGPSGETGTAGGEVAARPAQWGDFLLAGRDLAASYHLSCVVDDALQGITHVVRGRDLFASTSAHRLLQELFGYPRPAYCHHDLVLGEDGRKLSKSRGDTSIAALREAGMTRHDILRMVALDGIAGV